MQIIRLSNPEKEPITYSQAKAQLRVDLDTEKELIESYIIAAREYCENYQNRVYYTSNFKLITDTVEFPLEIPRPPIQSITSIQFQDKDGDLNTWNSENYIADTTGEFGVIRLAENYEYPDITFAESNILQVTFVAGFDNIENVPQRVKNACKLLVSHWYENRTPVVVGTISTEVEITIQALLGSDRVVPV